MDNTNWSQANLHALNVGKKDSDVPSVPSNWEPTPVRRNSTNLSRTQIIEALDQLKQLFFETGNNVGLRIVIKAQDRRGYLTERQAQWLERQIQLYGI